MRNLPEPGWYRDAKATEPVRLLGVGLHVCVGNVFLIVETGDEPPRYELLRPSEWDMPLTVKDGEGVAKVQRFTPLGQES